mmetsp:Transcript_46148/g.142218  ORF Transcript_46148/g.142218 Transcript_46148/m.142218 type:complete len:316 (-) Transcript_46148:1395-2342(-)
MMFVFSWKRLRPSSPCPGSSLPFASASRRRSARVFLTRPLSNSASYCWSRCATAKVPWKAFFRSADGCSPADRSASTSDFFTDAGSVPSASLASGFAGSRWTFRSCTTPRAALRNFFIVTAGCDWVPSSATAERRAGTMRPVGVSSIGSSSLSSSGAAPVFCCFGAASCSLSLSSSAIGGLAGLCVGVTFAAAWLMRAREVPTRLNDGRSSGSSAASSSDDDVAAGSDATSSSPASSSSASSSYSASSASSSSDEVTGGGAGRVAGDARGDARFCWGAGSGTSTPKSSPSAAEGCAGLVAGLAAALGGFTSSTCT